MCRKLSKRNSKVKKFEYPDTAFLRSVRDLLDLGISDERLVEVLKGLKTNWKFFEALESVPLDKEDDPTVYLARLINSGDDHLE